MTRTLFAIVVSLILVGCAGAPVGWGGTHEVMLGYCFNVKKKVKITSYQNARFLD